LQHGSQLSAADVPVVATQAFTSISSTSTTGVPSLPGKQSAGSSLSCDVPSHPHLHTHHDHHNHHVQCSVGEGGVHKGLHHTCRVTQLICMPALQAYACSRHTCSCPPPLPPAASAAASHHCTGQGLATDQYHSCLPVTKKRPLSPCFPLIPPCRLPPPSLPPQLSDPWERAKDLLLQGTVSDGVITGFNKGGVLVEMADLKGEGEGGGRGVWFGTKGSAPTTAAGAAAAAGQQQYAERCAEACSSNV
jgi:hypothetical protein